jgi:hypothetical protein
MSAEQLLHYTRPPEMDDPGAQYYGSRREEICALWLFRWLANWAPQDEKLRNEVLNQVRAILTA